MYLFENVLDKIVNTAEQATAEKPATESTNDYIGDDGLKHCGNCGGAKQIVTEAMGIVKTVNCICKCQRERDEALKTLNQRYIEIGKNRSVGIQDKKLTSYNFQSDDGSNPQIRDFAERYVKNFKGAKENNLGVIFYGEWGTGKSFYAGCIANALLDVGFSVLATSVVRLTNHLFKETDKNAFLRELCSYDLLIIDDLGAEQDSEYKKEQIFSIIDERYKSDKPVIITTNLNPQTFSEITDGRGRSYNRILEMCTPVEVNGQRRKAVGQAKAKMLNDLLYGNTAQ